jgi:hypothetical protein
VIISLASAKSQNVKQIRTMRQGGGMKSKQLFSFLLFFAATVCVTLNMFAETVQSKDRTFAVKYKDGTVEHYKVTWVATLDTEVHEDGHPAEPFNGWFTDTRQCHWSLSSHIDRQVAMINKVGQEFAQSSLSRTYRSDFTGKGSDFQVFGLRPENCNDAADRRNSDINDARKNVSSVFPGLVDADLVKLKADVKANAEVVEVSFQ